MSHLEALIHEYYEWRGYVVRRGVKVGRLKHGGWEGELDIVAFHPQQQTLLHLEPSIDAHSWAVREQRYERKFRVGRKYIFSEVFPWLDRKTALTQVAILVSRGKRSHIAGGTIRTVDELVAEMREAVLAEGSMATRAITELYPLLRTVQLVVSGYGRRI